MENKKKKIIGVQMEPDLVEAAQELAAEYGTNISSVIRMVLIDYLKRYKNYKVKKGNKE